MKIIIDSVALGAALYEVEQGTTMLGYLNDVDDMSDVEYYADRIRRAADDIRCLINTADPVKKAPSGDYSCKLRTCAKLLEEIAQYCAEEYNKPETVSDIRDIAQLLKYMATEEVQP